jgi:hypothetical protein
LVRPYRKNGKLITCQIVVKKIGKYPPDLKNSDDSIFTFFPKEDYYFDDGPLINYIQSIKIFSNDDLSNQSFCIRFYVIKDILYLSELNKCHYSGNINLEKIINYAKSFDYLHFIKLSVQEIFTEIKEQLTKFGKNNNNSNYSKNNSK